MPADEATAGFTVPRFAMWRLRFRKEFDEYFIERADEFANLWQSGAAVGGHESIMPHFGEPRRQGVLEIAAHKFEDFEGASAPLFFAAALVFKDDVGVSDFFDPRRSDGDAENILSQIFERPFSVPDLARIDHPVGFPYARWHREARGFELVDEFGAVDDGERPIIDVLVYIATFPFEAVFGESAAGYDKVYMRVIFKLARPCVKNPGEPGDIAPDILRIFRELFHRARCRLEERVITDLLIGTDEFAQFLGNGKSEHEVVDRKHLRELFVEPFVRLPALAGWAVPVAARAVGIVTFAAAATCEGMLTVEAGSAVADGLDRLLMIGGHTFAEALDVSRTVIDKEFFYFIHDPDLPSGG